MPKLTNTITIEPGEAVLIRTVTHYYTGRVAGIDDRWIALEDAAWVASTGRWANALATGALDEVEPWPDGDTVLVALGGVIDVSPWRHALPRATK